MAPSNREPNKSKKHKKSSSKDKRGLHGDMGFDIGKSGFNVRTEGGVNFDKLFD